MAGCRCIIARRIGERGGHDLANLETVCRSYHAAEHPAQVVISEAVTDTKRLRMNCRSSSGTRGRKRYPSGMEMPEGIQYPVGYDYYRDEIRSFCPTRIDRAETLLTEPYTPGYSRVGHGSKR